jgi:cation-transporting ATPase 13A3/4/5
VDLEEETYQSFENTAVFLMSSFQYIIVAIVFTVGPPYQEPIWNNGNDIVPQLNN